MNSKPLVLLDTSVQIERLMGSVPKRRAIEAHLATAECQFVTSSYVYMEFQRSVLADYARVYNLLLQHEGWEEVALALRSGVLAYRPRSLGRCLQILTQVMTFSRLDHADALSLLKATLQYDLPNRFWQHLTRLPDPIHCDLVLAGVTIYPNQHCHVADVCRKESAACSLPNFLTAHRIELQTIADYLSTHPQVVKEQPRLERLVRAVLDDPHAVLGQSTCWPLGDVIIALQALPDASIWSIDADFGATAQALGLSLYKPTLSR